ncbi:DNA-directed RNA polymerase subunit A', partial [Candidatus Woesearchaeota archaeon]|nr:DNA-directed RNA polymerase subunit A' [Candidatus Woesearchaeota archaeon]
GNYLLTKELVLSHDEAVDLLYSCGVDDMSELSNKDKIDGKEVFSMLLPKDFNFVGKDKGGNEVKIVNGILKTGLMDKANLGQESGLMLRNLYEKYGPAFAADLLGKISQLGIAVMAKRGFSIGIQDINLEDDTSQEVQDLLDSAEEEAKKFIDHYHANKLDPLPGRTLL